VYSTKVKPQRASIAVVNTANPGSFCGDMAVPSSLRCCVPGGVEPRGTTEGLGDSRSVLGFIRKLCSY
jgi:hypothetical protein